MGGNTDSPTRDESPANEKDVNEWLQIIIDSLASEYGWTKEEIFVMYPKEVEILIARIRARRETQEDTQFLRMIMAARAPQTEDGGQELINSIMGKYQTLATEKVTEESIKRELALARSLLQR